MCFRISDTGPGVPAGEHVRLFEIFSRLSEKVRGGKSGSGLGLALSRRLCLLMGGDITLENRRDGITGAVAQVRIPQSACGSAVAPPSETLRADNESSSCNEPIALGSRLTGRLRVLVADDHPYVREVLCEMLSSLECAVETTDNGLEALALASKGDFDVVLLDTWMPGMSGMQVAKEIRATSRNSAPPWLIGISASSRAEDSAACYSAGMDEFLAKPIDGSMLRAALRRSGRGEGGAMKVTESAAGSSWRLSRPGIQTELVLQSEAMLGMMEQTVESGNWELLRERVHYLENTAICVGWSDVAECCVAVGHAAAGQNGEQVRVALAELKQAMGRRSLQESTR